MILWAGTSNKDVGMVVEHYPTIVIPRRKQEIQQVPGRNGDIILYQDAYENYEQSYSVFLDSKKKGGMQKVIPMVSDWLLGHSGYQRLEDSYFPDVYRMAYYTGGMEFINYFNEYGAGNLTFSCSPEKYYKMGEREITLINGQIISNPSAFPAKPLIKITGRGNVMISFERDNLSDYLLIQPLAASSSTTATLSIDIRDHKAYIGSTNRNSAVTGLFEKMVLKGKTRIVWTGNVTKVTMIPRWWTL